MDKENIDLSIIIVSWNVSKMLDGCLNSIETSLDGLKAEIFVVDNASQDGSSQIVADKHPCVHLIANADNLGFGRANNQALRLSNGKYALLMNPDTLVYRDAIHEMIAFLEAHSQVALIGPEQYNQSGRLNLSGITHSRPREMLEYWVEWLLSLGLSRMPVIFTQPRQVSRVNGACWVVRREAILEIGLFDEGLFLYGEEQDVCSRLKNAGWETWLLRGVQIIHFRHQSIRQRDLFQDIFFHIQSAFFLFEKQLLFNHL